MFKWSILCSVRQCASYTGIYRQVLRDNLITYYFLIVWQQCITFGNQHVNPKNINVINFYIIGGPGSYWISQHKSVCDLFLMSFNHRNKLFQAFEILGLTLRLLTPHCAEFFQSAQSILTTALLNLILPHTLICLLTSVHSWSFSL